MMDSIVKQFTDAIESAIAAGFVVRGQFEIIKPATPGLLQHELHVDPKNNGVFSLFSVKTCSATKPEAAVAPEAGVAAKEPAAPRPSSAIIASLGYTGDICTCGSYRMVRSGACARCEDCGSSSGCS